jgi:hypothetical protein
VSTSDHVAVPAQHRLGADQQPDTTQHVTRQPVQQWGEQRPVSLGELGPRAVQLPFEDPDLMPQREDLSVFVTIAHGQ